MKEEGRPIMVEATRLVERSGLAIDPRAAVQQLLQSEALLVMDEVGTIDSVIFQGGSSICRCYDGVRMSEDLDFRMTAAISPPEIEELSQAIKKNVRDRYGSEPDVKLRGFDEPDPRATSCLTIKTEVSENKSVPKVVTKLDFDALPHHSNVLRPSDGPLDALRGCSMPAVMAKAPSELVADKLVASALTGLSGRRNPRARDAYDTCWLVDNWSVDLRVAGELACRKAAEYGQDAKLLPAGIRAFCDSIASLGYSPITSLASMVWDPLSYGEFSDAESAARLMATFAGICSVALDEPSLRESARLARTPRR